jgi:hypothetical protein
MKTSNRCTCGFRLYNCIQVLSMPYSPSQMQVENAQVGGNITTLRRP